MAVVHPLLLSHGTLLCRNLANTRTFYEEFLGLDVVRHAKPAMMVRLNSGMYIVCVCIGENVPNQHVLTHWGLNVATRAEVDAAHAAAVATQETYGIRKIQSVRERHGAYGFYMQDLDCNWWEIQHEERTINHFFNGGDKFGDDVIATDSADSHD
jgi:catechol 2,3-dioxygenase-like lactoylglutathione lyase family enzyme